MNNLAVAAKLGEVRAQGRAALIGYLPMGFPTIEQSIEAVITLIDAGVDIIELGIPYSDPVMDGPVIQAAAQTALDNGTHPRDVFNVIRQIKAQRPGTPILAMTYYNPVLRYGVEKFAHDLAQAGGAGLITADLVPDQGAEWIAAADKYGLDKVFLVAPSTPPERLAMVSAACRGFVYAASTMGVTGVRAQVGAAAQKLVADTRAAGAQYVCVGLGVSTAEQAKQVGSYADGVIVGSAFVKPLLDAAKPWSQQLADLAQTANQIANGVAQAARVPSVEEPSIDGVSKPRLTD